jgi:DNA polymerase III subunit epsilon
VRRESRLIRPPQMRFSPGNIRIHGILPADVRDAPNCAEVMAEFLPDLSGGLMLAHNAGFDMGVLAASLAAWGETVPELAGFCTLQIARRIFPDPAGHGLAKVAGRLGIRFEHHDAGEDAYACAEIALAALRETGATDIADLARGLGLTPIRAVAGPRRDFTRSTSAHALRASGIVDLRPKGELRFAMRGSTGNRYVLEFEERTDGPYLRCSCPAGMHRRAGSGSTARTSGRRGRGVSRPLKFGVAACWSQGSPRPVTASVPAVLRRCSAGNGTAPHRRERWIEYGSGTTL